MARRIRWGILGTAAIAVRKVIPAMQRGEWCDVVAIASRDRARAGGAADELGIPRAYGSYEELLADPDVDAVYVPLPNHLHVPWSEKAARAGKHVLCEKPIGLDAAEARRLLSVRDETGVKIGEAFMVRTHPQWLETRRRVRDGAVGELRLVSGTFSYYKRDPNDIRSRPEYGGGALMDIGCYPITLSRWLFDEEPVRVLGLTERDPDLGIDRLASAVMEFPSGHASFTCATQLMPYQRMHVFGSNGRIEVEIPFNAPPDRPCRVFVEDRAGGRETLELPIVDQYTLQGDAFSRAIVEDAEVPVPLEDAVANMAAIDAVFRSARSGDWEPPAL